jgi:hypothetical protein
MDISPPAGDTAMTLSIVTHRSAATINRTVTDGKTLFRVRGGSPPAVLAVDGWAVVLISVLAWWPDRIFGTQYHWLYLLATVAVTLVGFVLARRVRRLEWIAEQARAPLRTLAALGPTWTWRRRGV